MRGIAREHGLPDLIAPVRPNWKERYPLVAIDQYASWQTDEDFRSTRGSACTRASAARFCAPSPSRS